MRPFRRVVPCLATLLVLVVIAPAAEAEQPKPVIESLAGDGVFVHSRRAAEVDREVLAGVVDNARSLGYSMAIVVPLDPLPELRAFVLRVQQGGEFDIVLGYGLDGEVEASTSEAFGNSDRLSALSATRTTTGGAEELAARFLTELTTDPETELPDTVRTIIRWVVVMLVLLGVTIALEQLWRARSRRGQDDRPASGQSSSPPLA